MSRLFSAAVTVSNKLQPGGKQKVPGAKPFGKGPGGFGSFGGKGAKDKEAAGPSAFGSLGKKASPGASGKSPFGKSTVKSSLLTPRAKKVALGTRPSFGSAASKGRKRLP